MNYFKQVPRHNKYLYCLISFVLGISTISFAQTNLKWKRLYGSNLEEGGSGQLVSRTADGGFIIGLDTKASFNGDITSRSNGGSDIWLAKLDDAGEIQWSRLYGGSRDETISSVHSTPDGGFIVSGTTNSPISGDIRQTVPTGARYIWVFKLNSEGNIEWSRQYPKRDTDWQKVTSVKPSRDGGFIMTATIKLPYGEDDYRPIQQKTWIVKLNRLGTIQWEYLTEGTNHEVRNTPAEQTIDNGYAFGETATTDDFGRLIDKPDLIKLDQNGNLVLRQTIEEFGMINSLRESPDGGYILSGNSYTDDYDDYHDPAYITYNVTKIDTSGQVIWQTTTDYSFNDVLPIVGGYLAVATRYSRGGYTLIKLGFDGNEIWQRRIGGEIGYHGAPSIDVADFGFILAGITKGSMGDIGPSGGTSDLWVVRYWSLREIVFPPIWNAPPLANARFSNIHIDWQRRLNISTKSFTVQRSLDQKKWNAIGEVVGVNNQQHYSFTDHQPMVGKNYYRIIHIDTKGKRDTSSVASAVMEAAKSGFKVSPNPATNAIVLSGIEKGNTIRILNLSGAVIRTLTATGNSEYIDISKLPAGNYIVEVTTKKMLNRKTERFVKLK